VITQDGNNFGALDLLSGSWRQVPHPLTRDSVDFYFRRHYGCTYAKGCPSLIAFRSGNAGVFDLENMSGLHNLSGFKSGCTPSLIPGGGLLNAPEYTRTCGCSYPLQTSCALVHTPSSEIWTTNEGLAKRLRGGVITQLGLNFGAPGDRMDSEGLLWLDYPPGAGQTEFANQELSLAVEFEPADSLRYFRDHSMRASGDLPWVGASGVEGVKRITIDLSVDSLGSDSVLVPVRAPTRKVDITLSFYEPHGAQPGGRVFDVAVNGAPAFSSLDIAAETGAPRTTLSRTVGPVTVTDSVEVLFTPRTGLPAISGIAIRPHHE
jgi:hypothetical protein